MTFPDDYAEAVRMGAEPITEGDMDSSPQWQSAAPRWKGWYRAWDIQDKTLRIERIYSPRSNHPTWGMLWDHRRLDVEFLPPPEGS